MLWKKILLVFLCCIGFTIISTGIYGAGKFDFSKQYGIKNQTSALQIMQKAIGLESFTPNHFRQLKITKPNAGDFLMINDGLPYDQLKGTAVWGKYICFANKGLACLDSSDPLNSSAAIYPFDLLNGDLVYEGITDISGKDNILFVSTDKKIYKFVLAEDGNFTKSVVSEKGALQITEYKGDVVFKDLDGTLSGTDVSIPEFISGINNILSTKSYLLVVSEAGTYRWKPGLGDWESIENSKIFGIAADYKNDQLYVAVETESGGSKIVHCLLKPQCKCSKFWSDDKEKVTDLFIDGDKLYKFNGSEIASADKDAENPFFNFVASIDAKQNIPNVINGSLYSFSNEGIQFFVDKGISAQSEWSALIKPSMLSVKGGSFAKPWAGGLFLVKENLLYKKVNDFWEEKSKKVYDFAVSGNYGLIYENGGKIDLVDFADIIDGVEPEAKGSIKVTSLVTAFVADDKNVFIAAKDHLHECLLPVGKDIDLKDCTDTGLNSTVNDLTNIPTLEDEILVCADSGIYRWEKETNKIKQFTAMPCKATAFADDKLYVTNNMGEILMLNDKGDPIKQLCKKLQPMKGGLETKENAIYIADVKRGVVAAHKKLFTEELCPATEAPAPEEQVLMDLNMLQFNPICNGDDCPKALETTDKECVDNMDCSGKKICKDNKCVSIDEINGDATSWLDYFNDNGFDSGPSDQTEEEVNIVHVSTSPQFPDGNYPYNTSADLVFKVTGTKPGEHIGWNINRDTAVYYTKSNKQYVYQWNKIAVPSDCKDNTTCTITVKFRLGNSKEYEADSYKVSLGIIDYFKHIISVNVVVTPQYAISEEPWKSVVKEFKYKFNKPKLEDEAINGATLAFRSYVEWVDDDDYINLYVNGSKDQLLAQGIQKDLSDDYEEGHVKVVKPLAAFFNGSTFKDVESLEMHAADWGIEDTLPGPGLYFNLNYYLLAGKDVYAIVESGWYTMVVDKIVESWHWKVGEDIHFYMRCHPDDEESSEPDTEDFLACGEEQGAGNM